MRDCRCYPKKSFTLDGRLVGDLGEMLAECNYQINVFPGCRPRHDGETTDGTGRLVQIKVAMKNSLTFPADHIPDYYLGLLLTPDGSFKEIFNGPGAVAAQAIAARQLPKTNLHSVGLQALRTLDATAREDQRVPRRR